MTTACTTNEYFSGQGALLIGERDSLGKPAGLREVGNVSALSIGVETSTFEHKESCSGVRGIDLEIVQEINVSMAMTIESMTRENLELALYGASSSVAAGSVTNEVITGYHDLWVPLANIKVSAVVVTNVAGTTTYVLGTDYLLNLDAGTIKVLSLGSITASQTLHVDYSFALQSDVQGVTSGTPPIKYVRFEGLNTADTNKPVIIDVYKVSFQPLATLDLITDEITQMEIEAKVLSDALQTGTSKYFKVRKV